MGTPSLGLVGAYGAAGASEGFEDFLKRRIEQQLAQRQVAEQERRARAIEAAEAASLAQRQAEAEQQNRQYGERLGFDRERLDFDKQRDRADANKRGLDIMKGEAEIMDATTARSDRDALRNDPVYGKVIGLRSAGVPTAPIDPMDPTGEIEHGRSLDRITASGDQNVRSANASRAGRVVPVRTKDASGKNVTRYMSIDEAASQDWEVQDTADMRNYEKGQSRARVVLENIAELSERINTQEGVIAKMSGVAERAKAQLNLSDDVAEYEALVEGVTPLLARGLGHKGVLTEPDVQSTRKFLPGVTDSKNLRDRKVKRALRIMGEMDAVDSGRDQSGTTGTGQSLDPNPPADQPEFDYVPGQGMVPRKR